MIRANLPKVAIITSGYMPVPNVLGGAVEALDMMLINENEKTRDFSFTVFSNWTKEAEQVAIKKNLQYTTFRFIKIPKLIKLIDRCIFAIAKYILHKKKLSSYSYIAQRLWYIHKVAKELSQDNTDGVAPFDKVMIENHATLFMTMQQHNNTARYRDRVYYHLHNEFVNDFGCIKEVAQIHKVLGVSQFSMNTINTYLLSSGLPQLLQQQMCVVRNGIDTRSFGTEQSSALGIRLRKKYKIPQDDIVFLFSGRLTAEKGVLELFQAFKTVHANNPHTHLVIVGAFFYNANINSPFEENLHKLAEDNSIKDSITFTGFIPYEQMPALYGMTDVCVLPSICEDAAPLAVIEGIVSGKPIITTLSGGIPEYVDSECSIILQRDEHLTDNMASAMIRLASDEKLRSNMSNHSQELAQDLTSETFAKNLIAALKD